jgi:23S rRNA pseudouridine1911/1915/1917 synthase
LIEELRRFRRQALHAHRLAFSHPSSGKAIDVSSEPPDDFQQLLAVLRGDKKST